MKRRCLSLLSPPCASVRHCRPPQLAAFPRIQRSSVACRTLSRRMHTASAHISSVAASLSADASLSPPPPLPLHPSSPPTRLPVREPSSSADDATAEPFYTLGLDINTQSIGYVLLAPSLRTLQRGVISLSHLSAASTPAPRLLHVTEQLSAVLACLPPHARLHTAVESYLLSFRGGRFQTRHLFQLAALNSQVQCQLWHLSGRRYWPAVVNVNSARSRFGLKGEVTESKSGRRVSDVKGVVWRWVDERLRRERDGGSEAKAAGGAELEWRRKRDGSVHATMYDISDAYLIALTAAMEHKQQQSTEAAVGQTAVVEEGSGTKQKEDEGEEKLEARKKPRVRKVRAVRAAISSSSLSSESELSASMPKTRRRRIAASD